jgi:hypothetical protein
MMISPHYLEYFNHAIKMDVIASSIVSAGLHLKVLNILLCYAAHYLFSRYQLYTSFKFAPLSHKLFAAPAHIRHGRFTIAAEVLGAKLISKTFKLRFDFWCQHVTHPSLLGREPAVAVAACDSVPSVHDEFGSCDYQKHLQDLKRVS